MSTPVDAPHRLGSDEEIPESQDEEITSESSSDEDEELSSSDEESDSSTADGSGKTKFSLSSMLTRGDSDSDDEDSEQKRLNLVKNITKLSNGTYAAADMNTPAETRPESQFTSSSASGKVQLSAETLLGALGGGVSDKLLTESVQVNEANRGNTGGGNFPQKNTQAPNMIMFQCDSPAYCIFSKATATWE